MKTKIQWSIASTSVVLLSLLSYLFADIQTALWFHAIDKTFFYKVFCKVTLFGDSFGYLIGGLLLFAIFCKWNYYWASSGLFLFSTVAVSGLSADLVKYVAGRARPKLYFQEHLYGFNSFHWEHAWTSFPSGHSATALSVATLLAILYPRWRVVALFCGFLIAFSRIVLTEHYISDVIAGSFLGIVSTVLLYNLYFKAKFEATDHHKI